METCNLFKHKKIYWTHWIGKSGKMYDKNEYGHFGDGKERNGVKDLPIDDYPYKGNRIEEPLFGCCKYCNCQIKLK